ncbi:hypothetical protein NA57DRAFT_71729 [Rhizodiscina lignyota]|uniref:MARVEL domain-containing protein n=1 Tax=Rhizodiscina lignyota TaxID=1504668 RepID=A0A9P4INZ1_9PEZI|nr:hypothetical protein NA57DRAFT_71729 [Rhizodiscina lignyota]
MLSWFFLFYEAFADLRGRYDDMKLVTLAIDALNTIFFFCGAVALSAALGVHSCENSEYTDNNPITKTSDDTNTRCREAQATTAFLWLGFLTFAFTTAMSALYWLDPELVLHREHRPDPESQGAPPMAASEPRFDRRRNSTGTDDDISGAPETVGDDESLPRLHKKSKDMITGTQGGWIAG